MNTFELGRELDKSTMYLLLDEDLLVSLPKESLERVKRCRAALESRISSEKPIYGVSTGFGHLASKWIPREKLEQLQLNLIRSHAAGMGERIPDEIVLTAMKLLANSLSKGLSGVREETLSLLVEFCNRKIIPVTYRLGSLGASGDLAPLAHVALALIGEGEVSYAGKVQKSGDLLKELGLSPARLQAKEGLALINGTHFITAYALHILSRARSLVIHSAVASALSLEAVRGTDTAFDERIHSARGQKGQMVIARLMRELLRGSEILLSHRDMEVDHKVQDPYVYRCIPQVMGAVLDSLEHLETIVSREVNAVTDNPLIFEHEVLSGGNFHAEPLALPLELVSMALVEVANITERRLDRLVHPHTSELPAFLAKDPGVESGYMIPHYTAAAIVNRMRVLSHPAVTDNISVSGSQEDHVSMGMTSATKGLEILELCEVIVSLELLFAVRGLNMQEGRPLSSSVLEDVLGFFNEEVPFQQHDHYVREDMSASLALLRNQHIVEILPDTVRNLS